METRQQSLIKDMDDLKAINQEFRVNIDQVKGEISDIKTMLKILTKKFEKMVPTSDPVQTSNQSIASPSATSILGSLPVGGSMTMGKAMSQINASSVPSYGNFPPSATQNQPISINPQPPSIGMSSVQGHIPQAWPYIHGQLHQNHVYQQGGNAQNPVYGAYQYSIAQATPIATGTMYPQQLTNPKGNYLFPTRMTKLDFPKFEGDGVKSWLSKCERFFKIDQTPDHGKVLVASLALEGKALSWYQTFEQHMSKYNLPLAWSSFSTALLHRFGKLCEDPMGEWMKMKQKDFKEKSQLCSELSLNDPSANDDAKMSDIKGTIIEDDPENQGVEAAELFEKKMESLPIGVINSALTVNENSGMKLQEQGAYCLLTLLIAAFKGEFPYNNRGMYHMRSLSEDFDDGIKMSMATSLLKNNASPLERMDVLARLMNIHIQTGATSLSLESESLQGDIYTNANDVGSCLTMSNEGNNMIVDWLERDMGNLKQYQYTWGTVALSFSISEAPMVILSLCNSKGVLKGFPRLHHSRDSWFELSEDSLKIDGARGNKINKYLEERGEKHSETLPKRAIYKMEVSMGKYGWQMETKLIKRLIILIWGWYYKEMETFLERLIEKFNKIPLDSGHDMGSSLAFYFSGSFFISPTSSTLSPTPGYSTEVVIKMPKLEFLVRAQKHDEVYSSHEMENSDVDKKHSSEADDFLEGNNALTSTSKIENFPRLKNEKEDAVGILTVNSSVATEFIKNYEQNSYISNSFYVCVNMSAMVVDKEKLWVAFDPLLIRGLHARMIAMRFGSAGCQLSLFGSIIWQIQQEIGSNSFDPRKFSASRESKGSCNIFNQEIQGKKVHLNGLEEATNNSEGKKALQCEEVYENIHVPSPQMVFKTSKYIWPTVSSVLERFRQSSPAEYPSPNQSCSETSVSSPEKYATQRLMSEENEVIPSDMALTQEHDGKMTQHTNMCHGVSLTEEATFPYSQFLEGNFRVGGLAGNVHTLRDVHICQKDINFLLTEARQVETYRSSKYHNELQQCYDIRSFEACGVMFQLNGELYLLENGQANLIHSEVALGKLFTAESSGSYISLEASVAENNVFKVETFLEKSQEVHKIILKIMLINWKWFYKDLIKEEGYILVIG